MKKYLLNIILLYFSFFMQAQQDLVYKNYNSTNGMFSSVTNCIVQDNSGTIWVGTQNGLSKFNGYSFKNYTIDNGLIDNNIIDFYKDNDGVIWFISGNNNIAYIKNDSIFKYKYNYVIDSEFYINSKYIKHSLFVEQGEVSFAVNNIGLYTINKSGKLKKEYSKKLIAGNAIVKQNGKNAYILDSYLDNDTLLFVDKPSVNKKEVISWRKLNHQFVAAYKKNNFYINENEKLLIFKNQIKIKTINLNSKIISIKSTKKYLWVSTIKDGLVLFKLENGIPKYIGNFLREYIINYIYEDYEGAYWFSTRNNGLLYVPDINRQVIFTKKKGNNIIITDMEVLNNEIYLSYSNGIIENINTKKIIKLDDENKVYEDFKLSSNLRNIYALYNNKIYLIKDNNSKIIIDLDLYGERVNFNNIFVDNNDIIWVSNKSKIIKINNNNIENIFTMDKKMHSEITNILKSPEGLFISVKNGLWKFANNYYYSYSNTNKEFDTDIIKMSTDRYGFVTLLSTNGKGLIVLSKDSVYFINKKNGITSNIVTSACYNDSTIVIGTNNGIEILYVDNKFNINKHKVYKIVLNNTSNQVNKVLNINGNIYYITNNNLYKVTTKGIEEDKYLPSVIIENIRVNNHDTIFALTEPVLKDDENNITFKFLGVSYKNAGDINYKYKLDENGSDWQYTKSTSIDYSFLPFGKHKFMVCAANNDGVWSKPLTFTFVIERPFYYTWWFVLITLLFIIFFIYIVVRTIINNIKRKERMKKDVLMYKQQALRKQMNPHFIFNSLNSIQHFILQNDKRMSSKYLSRFSQLIRIVLENSQENLIPIEKELTAIKLYLEIESLRFKDKFTYTIDISDEIDTANCKISPLLLQPFLENSIWHGLMNINDGRKGVLLFKMTKKDDNIICIIDDNGVGRYKAKEIRDKNNKKHKSLASEITNERVELFNYENNKKITMRYIDKYDSNKIATGSKVEIIIPIIY